MATLICIGCGKEFDIRKPPYSGKNLYCSQPCAARHIGMHTIANNRKGRLMPDPAKKETFPCGTCGTLVARYKKSGNQNKFCSLRCASLNEDVTKRRIISFNSSPKPRVYSRCNRGWRQIGARKIFARSTWEANYARFLEFQKVWGQIFDWEHEAETFWFDGIKRGVRSYLPDFKVTNLDGSIEFHEVKGWMDKKSKTKIRRMAKYHPAVRLIVKDAKWFKANLSKLRGCIPEWETTLK